MEVHSTVTCSNWWATKTGFGVASHMESVWETLSSAMAALKSTLSWAKWSGQVEGAIHLHIASLCTALPRSSGWGWCCIQITVCLQAGRTNMHGSHLSCALTSTAFPFVHHPLRVLSKRHFFYPSSDPWHNREFMELAWPWGEVLHHYIDPLIESHSQMTKMKQETNRTALSLREAGLLPWEGKTRCASTPQSEVFGHIQAPGWSELGYRDQMHFWRVTVPHPSHLCLKNPLMQPLQKNPQTR